MTTLHGFELLVEQHIPELNTHARLFRHLGTGAQLLSLENDDENKVFSINFRTPPPDSTGLPHIMEHSVLCGSRKYPVREPFVELMKGSLATFVNAFTYPDKTCYPVASQNVQDFYNLIDVYMDAALYPLLAEHTLDQEGWHYELNSLDEPLTFKGVVFNEMKGAYSSPDDLLYKYSQETLFPGHPYGLDSGGDPTVIPNLTYAQFKAFHDTYYHPSNARIFFYGDDDPEERLRRMDDYLKEFHAVQVASEIPPMPPFEQPHRFEFPYAVEAGEENPKAFLAVNWALPEAQNCQAALGLNILNHILIGTPASPLRKALIDSGLGEDLAGGGLEMSYRQAIFSTGLKGILSESAEKVEALVLDTLQSLAQQGISADTVAASLNTVEFRLRENNTGRFPRGIALMLSALQAWLYEGDPIERLSFEAPLEQIKSRLEQGEAYFENLIRSVLLENTHRATVLLKPDANLAQRQEAEEKVRLQAAQAAMNQADLAVVLENTAALKRRQETPDTPEALATIPSLRVADLDRQGKVVPLEIFSPHGSRIFYHDLFTNGILYLDIGLDLHTLPQEYLPYVNLFGRALLEMGNAKEDYVSLLQRIGRSTGGIKPVAASDPVLNQAGSAAWLFLRAKAMPAQAAELLGILQDVLLTARLDHPQRFRQIVLEEKANREAHLAPMGHIVTATRLWAGLSEADWVKEQMGGLSYLFFLRRLAEMVEKDWPSVLEVLEQMRRILLNRRTMLCNVTLDAANWAAFQPELEAFLAALPEAAAAPMQWQPDPLPPHEGLTMPSQVNFVTKGANLYAHGYRLDGSILVINKYLQTTWLWERVRVQGGAYGGFSVFDHRSGTWGYISYRDPNLMATLENYDGTGQFLRTLELSQEELEHSIVGTIGEIDDYQLPDARGYTSLLRYLSGVTDESRQRIRQEVLGTTQADFRAFGDVLDQVQRHGRVVVLGSTDAIETAARERSDWLTISRVM